MRIAVPLANGRLAAHFGHCEAFALIDADPETGMLGATDTRTPPPHEPGLLPRWLHEQGADVIIAGGMGRRAQTLFQEQGIAVHIGASAETPEALARAFLDNTLQTGPNICDH
jgi:ATP-binding protein involved in chromosome partitioning